MIKFEHTEIVGWEHAIRGMRNPMNSWEKSDSGFGCDYSDQHFCSVYEDGHTEACPNCFKQYKLGPNDHDLMMRLAKGGPVHAKYRRMITVYVDVTAPLYWWKEFDTYKVGTVANSCSTMHKIAAKEFTLEDFSTDHLFGDEDMLKWDERTDIAKDHALAAVNVKGDWCYFSPKGYIQMTCNMLNRFRQKYLETKDKKYWWQMIQLLPSSYNQKRTIMLNYEVLNNIYHSRKDHKLDEWRDFCKWIEGLPYSEIITGGKEKEEESIAKLVETILSNDKERWPTACDLCNSQGCGDSNEEICKKCILYNHSKWTKVEHLVDISRPSSDHPHYVIGLGASESDLTDYEKELLKKSEEYWKDKK